MPTRPSAAWLYAACLAASVGVCAVLGRGFINASSPTYDEPPHLASGYVGLVLTHTLDWREHPPVAEMWAALPLLRLNPSLPLDHSATLFDYADFFLYKNSVPAERLLNTARWWCLLSWTLLLFAAILDWSRREGGAPGLVAGAVMAAFCVPWFSNAALVTTDAAPAVFYFLTFWLLSFQPRRLGHWILAGIAMGLGMASKFSLAVLPVFAAIVWLSEGRVAGFKKRGEWTGIAACAVAAVVSLLAAYRFTEWPLYVQGLTATATRLDQGRSAFLLGMHSTTGFWLYFPVALLVKTPLPILLLGSIGLWLWLRKPQAQGLWLVFPAAAYFVSACFSKTQIGYRHILPVYPFLIVLGARAASRFWSKGKPARVLVGVLGLWLVVGVCRAYPDYLAYFNEIAGGPSHGYEWLADSNLDWGQGMKELSRWVAAKGNPPIYLSYFGPADPSYYGIRYLPIGFINNVSRRQGVTLTPAPGPVYFAVSATNYDAVYYEDKTIFGWLKSRKPVYEAGWSIFVYDLTDDQKGREALARLAALSGYPQAGANLETAGVRGEGRGVRNGAQ